MYSQPNQPAKDHYRGTWNVPIADNQHSVAHFNGSTNAPPPQPAVKGSDPNNPFDSPFADLTAVAVKEIDPHFKTQLASKMQQRHTSSEYNLPGAPTNNGLAPAAFPSSTSLLSSSTTTTTAPSRPPPTSQRNPPPPSSSLNALSYDTNLHNNFQQQSGYYSPPPPVSEPMYSPDQYQSTYLSPQNNMMYGASSPQSSFGGPYSPQYSMGQPPIQGGGFDENFGTSNFGSSTMPSTTNINNNVDSSWDPFFDEKPTAASNEAPFDVKSVGKNSINEQDDSSSDDDSSDDDEEQKIQGARDDNDDSSSDIDDEENYVGTFDETSLARVIPTTFDNSAALKTFLVSPIESEKLVKCVILFDPTEKVWTFINQSNGVQLMTAFKRKDGLKRLTTQMTWAINYSPRALTDDASGKKNSKFGRYGKASTKTKTDKSELYIAKMKSNVGGSQFEIFDAGLNPSKAVGAMHARRELGAIRFEKMPHDSHRRKVRACVPSIGHNRRPRSKKELMFERLSQGDPTVTPLANHVPGKSFYLPRLSDFQGMALQSSVKNIMFHNPNSSEGETIYVLGKTSKQTYNCYFREPIAPVMAFSIALASISSYVNPSS